MKGERYRVKEVYILVTERGVAYRGEKPIIVHDRGKAEKLANTWNSELDRAEKK